MRLVLLMSASASLLVATPAAAGDGLPAKAEAVLRTHCFGCHGREGTAKGGMNYVLDRDKLVAREKLLPGRPADSPLFQRVAKGEMPPESVKARPTDAEVRTLQEWIASGAPAARPSAARREFLSEPAIADAIFADLKALEVRERPYARYFTFCNLHNAGVAGDDLQVCRRALAKLLNSLSWHPRIAQPQPLDAARTIYRIDLRDLQWSAQTWTRILAEYPHHLPVPTAAMKQIAAATRTELPFVRADWFIATASRPPLYHDILQLPLTDRDLERMLRVDVPRNIREDRVARAGFNGSGVARNNRLIERHDAGFGAYWRSYDFAEGVGRQNLFEHPLGPQPAPNGFVHSGGEIIFHLPNGLQGYLVVDANGRRIDRAPVEIVSDPRRPDKTVETGLSCISCHVRGLHPKSDQIRAHVEKNPNAFSKEDVAGVRALYPPEAKFKALLDEDVERFVKALAKTGVRPTDDEPVLAAALRYEGDLDLASASAEVGLSSDQFAAKLSRSPLLQRGLGALMVRGGTVQRQAFLAALPDVLREFQLADGSKSGADFVAAAALEHRPFAGHRGHVLCVAFSPNGNQAVSGSEDHTARLWNVSDGREVRSLVGHGDEVLAVAFSPDGKRVLTGSADRTVRLWDATSGRELLRLEGHTERVASVAISPDGRRALSGGWDQAISLWDLQSGQEIRRLLGHGSHVTAVAFSPDGRTALSGSYDGTVRLWDLETGREWKRFDSHAKEVYAIAFSPDGRFVASGGNDQTVRLWDLSAGREARVLEGHAGAVIAVRFSTDGKRLLSGGSQYRASGQPIRVWDAKSGRERHRIGRPSAPAWCVAFSPDGRHALTGSSDHTLQLWQIQE